MGGWADDGEDEVELRRPSDEPTTCSAGGRMVRLVRMGEPLG